MYVYLEPAVILDTWSQRTFSAAREEGSSRRPKCRAVAAFHVQSLPRFRREMRNKCSEKEKLLLAASGSNSASSQ